jgi:hypothetical protein
MQNYTNLHAAIDRIDRAILELDADIREWTMLKSHLFSQNKRSRQSAQPQTLVKEFDRFLIKSVKVRENLLVFRGLFRNISDN